MLLQPPAKCGSCCIGKESTRVNNDQATNRTLSAPSAAAIADHRGLGNDR